MKRYILFPLRAGFSSSILSFAGENAIKRRKSLLSEGQLTVAQLLVDFLKDTFTVRTYYDVSSETIGTGTRIFVACEIVDPEHEART